MITDRPAQRAWRVGRWAPLIILLVAFALRLYRLGDKNIWWDEGISIWVAHKSFGDATLWSAQDTSPPLYYWSLWTWIRLAGDSEFAARFISAIWGTLTVAVAYPLGKRLGGQRVGLLAALFLAVARFHIWWSQEMRMHILAPLVATLTLYAAVRWLDEERQHLERREAGRPPWAWAILYALATAGCLYTLYLAGLAPLAANAYALLVLAAIPGRDRWRIAARWLAVQVAALVLFAPWLLLALRNMKTWSVAEPFSLRLLLFLYGTLLGLGVSTDIERYLIYLTPFAVALLAGLGTLLWPHKSEPGAPAARAAFFLFFTVASMPLVVYIMTRPRSLFYTPRMEARYLLLFAPAFYILIAWSVARLGRRLPLAGLAVLASCLAVMVSFLPGYYGGRRLHDEMQSMMRILATYARPDDAILLISGDRWPLFTYYYERIVPLDRRGSIVCLPQTSRFAADNVEPQLVAATAGHQRFWLAAIEPGIQDPSGLSLPWLNRHFSRLLTYDEGHNALILYGDEGTHLLAEPGDLAPQRPLQAQGGGLELFGYDLPVHECQAGDMVNLGLYRVSRQPGRMEVLWRRRNGESLQTVAQDWPATGPAAERAAIRFATSSGYPGGDTHFLLRWTPAGQASPALTLELPGPCILELPRRGQATNIAQPLDVPFAGGIRLRGYNLYRSLEGGKGAVRPDEELTLDLFWEATEPVAENYAVFSHLVGGAYHPLTGLRVWGQHDGPPGDGIYPTSAWAPGQLIVDRHVLRVDARAPAGDYELEVGLYLPATGERLQLSNGEDHVVLTHIIVQP